MFPYPKDSIVVKIDEWEPNFVITILGFDHNQLVRFGNDGVVNVREFDLRFSACRKDMQYKWEATGHK